MKIIIDMNLSPDWVQEFANHKIEAKHWSSIGKFDSPDEIIIEYARKNDYVVFTHDLDFGTLLALSHAKRPSVIQVRTQDVTIANLSGMIFTTLSAHANLLENGALIVIDEDKKRVRILPI